MVSKISTLLGAVLLLAALCLWGYNHWEDQRAGYYSSQHLQELVSQIPQVTENPQRLDLNIPEVAEEPAPEDVKMQEVIIKGYAYIGYLSLPSLELELPIMSSWNYTKLDVAPCRYSGTMKGESLVLLAHNYPNHFGKIKELEIGEVITFTDMEGSVYTYQVAAHEVLSPSETEKMIISDYALTLFTCTDDSQSRVVVRCNRTV